MSSTLSAGEIGSTADAPCSTSTLLSDYQAVRRQSETLCEPLEPEDFLVQSMPDASPAKWHLAHTSWFFETFVLASALANYRPRYPQYNYLFNSYYNAVGERISRDKRGLMSRPSIAEVQRYRNEIDSLMEDWLGSADEGAIAALAPVIVLGLNHEQQHQELILTDLKHAFAANPLRPIYLDREPTPIGATAPMTWTEYPEGVRWVGHSGPGYAFDNESPRHRQFVGAFRLANRLTTVAEYLNFINDGGYDRPEFWLSDGWNACGKNRWTSPLYWEEVDGRRQTMTLAGLVELSPSEPVTHISFYEAEAFARWSGARLATEAEWEVAAANLAVEGNFLESGRYHPAPLTAEDSTSHPSQMFGDVWEWTQSPYSPYPGYRPAPGALGEYNGKFMCNQMVLRGGSCASPRSHIRATYRNFFGPEARWQFTGIRLAQDLA